MKKMFLIVLGLVLAAAFIGFDAVHAFVDQTRHTVRASLMTPEMDLQAKISEAKELSEKCAESVVAGRVSLARLDAMIAERERERKRRGAALERDRLVLETRRTLLAQNRAVYVVHDEEVSRRTLDRDACLRAKAFATDREVLRHVEQALEDLRAQRARTAADIEEAAAEQARLDVEVRSLQAELESLKARRAVAQTREEAAYVFDRSTFDRARDKIAEIRATIAEQNQRLDFYGRRASDAKGLVPADVEAEEESGADAIAIVLGESAPSNG